MYTIPFHISPSDYSLSHDSKIITIGSCFSDHIGQYLERYKFDCLSNPFGIIYNPYSIFKLLKDIATQEFDINNTIQNGDIHYHWDAHGSISALDEHALHSRLKEQSALTHDYISKSDWIVITLGTAFVYKLQETEQIVANCHKLPKSAFNKQMLSISECLSAYQEMRKAVNEINTKARIILTVSPVRHIRDGLVENTRSKALLHLLTHEILNIDQSAQYFHAFELVMDVLRDYRYYNEDMVHPSQQAVKFVWDQFCEAYMEPQTIEIMQEWEKVLKAVAHRPFHPKAAAHQKFLRKTLEHLKQFDDHFDTSEEITELKKDLI